MNDVSMRRRAALRTALATLCATPVLAAAEPPADGVEPYLRARDAGAMLSLETGARRLVHPAGGPEIDLVGVTHVGEPGYYRALQRRLDGADIVLYESVKPAGTGGAGGATPTERVASTRAAMGFVAGLVESMHGVGGRYPESIEELRGFAVAQDPRTGTFLDIARMDAWGARLAYQRDAEGFVLRSYGADGAPGGEDEARDLVVREGTHAPAPAAEDGVQLQGELARMLGLAFQLDAIDYGARAWWCSDMSLDQLQRALAARGADPGFMAASGQGFGLPPQIVRGLVDVVRMADAMMAGMLSDTMKVLMVEMLGDPALIDQSFEQLGPGLAGALIEDRNAIVLADLERIRAIDDGVRRVAVFYGAGHMEHMEQELRAAGYVPAETTWFDAIAVDLRDKPMVRDMAQGIRDMMSQMGGM